MASSELSEYLTDHLVTSISDEASIDRLLADQARLDPGLVDALGSVARSIRRHQAVLNELLQRRGDRGERWKSMIGWVVDRWRRPAAGARDEFELLRTLDALILGLHARVALWRTMEAVIPSHPELQSLAAGPLREEAERDLAQVDLFRVATARIALRGWTSGAWAPGG